MGFEVEGVLRRQYVIDGAYVDEIVMGLFVNPPDGRAGNALIPVESATHPDGGSHHQSLPGHDAWSPTSFTPWSTPTSTGRRVSPEPTR